MLKNGDLSNILLSDACSSYIEKVYLGAVLSVYRTTLTM